MAENVLSTLFTEIGDAIHEKTGNQEKLSPYAFADEIRSIQTGSVTVEGEVGLKKSFPREEISGFSLVTEGNGGVYGYIYENVPFAPVVGNTYDVLWDDAVYTCTATNCDTLIPGLVGIGNVGALEDSELSTGEPFAIGYINGSMMFVVMTSEDKRDTHTVGIFPLSMSDFREIFVEVMPDTEVTGFEWAAEYNGYLSVLEVNKQVLVSGEKYFVFWDDELYECESFSVADDNPFGVPEDSVFIGNLSHFIETSEFGADLPFAMVATPETPETSATLMIGSFYSDSHTVGIYQEELTGTPVLKEAWLDGFQVMSNGVVVRSAFIVDKFQFGDKYNVRLDGATYPNVPVTKYPIPRDPEIILIGNAYIANSALQDTSEPFVIVESGAGMTMAIAETSDTSHKIGIYKTKSDTTKFVQFIYHDAENKEQIYTKPVIIGDDCPDPVITNKIETPFSTSGNFLGWSTDVTATSVEENALLNITENRLLYPVFETSST